MRALVGLLSEDGVIEAERLERMWSERCQRDTVEQEENLHRDALRLRILASAQVADKQVFEGLVNEGFVLIEDRQVPQGMSKLQAAAEIRSRRCSSVERLVGAVSKRVELGSTTIIRRVPQRVQNSWPSAFAARHF